MKAPTIITSMARALGIVSTTEEVAIVPLEQWHRVFERLRAAEARVQELEAKVEDYETAPGTAQQVIDISKPGLFLMGSSRVKINGVWMNRFSVQQIGEAQLAAVEQGKP